MNEVEKHELFDPNVKLTDIDSIKTSPFPASASASAVQEDESAHGGGAGHQKVSHSDSGAKKEFVRGTDDGELDGVSLKGMFEQAALSSGLV